MFIQADQIRKRLTLIFLNKFSTIITTQHVKIQIRREAKSIVEKNSSSMKIFFNFKFSGKKSERAESWKFSLGISFSSVWTYETIIYLLNDILNYSLRV